MSLIVLGLLALLLVLWLVLAARPSNNRNNPSPQPPLPRGELEATRDNASSPWKTNNTASRKQVHFAPYVRVKEVDTEWQLRKAGLAHPE